MRSVVAFLLIVVLGFLGGMFLPWWSIAIVAFSIALWLMPKTGIAFITAFSAIFLLWIGLNFLLSAANHNILSDKIARLIIKSPNTLALHFMSALIGGLVAGFAAMSGSLWHKIIFGKKFI